MNRAPPARAMRLTAQPAAAVVTPPPAAAAIQAERLRLAQAKRTARAKRRERGMAHGA